METLFIITLLLFFIPFLWGLGGINVLLSGVSSPDNILKIVMLYLMLIVLFARGKTKFRKNVTASAYLIPSIIFLLILVYHYLNSGQASSDQLFFAKKEIVRLAFFIVILAFSSALRMKIKDYRLLVYQFVLLGIPLGLMAVRSALIGTSTRRGMMIGELVRAGGDLTSTNNLAAVLNITTLCALSAFLIAKKRYQKIVCLGGALISQAGRFATFSNGSFAGIVVSVFVVLFLFKKFDSAMYMRSRRTVIIFIVVLSAITISSGKAALLLGRLSETDKAGTLVSVSTRKAQYEGLWNLIVNEPDKLLFGVGSANVHSALRTSQTLHNAYLLPLVTAGVGGFVSFIYLWWLSFRNFYAAVKFSAGDKEAMMLTIFVLAAYVGYSVQILTVPYSLSATTWFFFILSFSFMNYVKEKRAVFASCPHHAGPALPAHWICETDGVNKAHDAFCI